MTINLDKFKYDLVEGWREVLDSKNPIDWAIFGYDGQSFDLKLVSKGAGGVDEMIDSFNSSRIMYGLCRVKLKDRSIEKIVLINWQGEGAPLARKGTCANHVSTVKNFFKGVHVTINARTDEDVDPDVIESTVAKATSAEGVRMSTTTDLDLQTEPVGAVYKRVNPKEEINSQAKDDFWRKEEAEEESRKKVEKGRAMRFSQNEVKLLRKESQDYFELEQQEKVISPVPTPSPTPSLPTSTNGDFNGTTSGDNVSRDSASPISPAFSNVFIATEKAAVLKASIPRKNPTENLVRQRIKSFDGNLNESLYSFNTPMLNGGVQSFSKTSADGETLSVMKRKQLFESGKVSNTSQTIVRKNPALEIKTLQEESQNQAKAATAHASSERVRSSPSPSSIIQEEILPIKASVSPQPPALAVKSHPSQNTGKAYNLPFQIGGSVSSRLAEKINKNSCDSNGSENNQNGNSFSSAEYSSTNISKNTISVQPRTVTVASTAVTAEFQAAPIPQHITTNFEQSSSISKKVTSKMEPVTIPLSKSPTPTPPPPRTPDEQKSTPVAVKQENNNESYEDTTVQSAEINKGPPIISKKESGIMQTPIGSSFVIKPEMGLCARALYDYQAADESEITFDPGEIITNIETVDEGWWEGMGPHGLYGLFPSNYVELLN